VKKTMEKKPGYAGMKFLQAKTVAKSKPEDCQRPLLISNGLGADGKLVTLTDPNSLYSGCYVNAVVQAYTYDHGTPGISFGLVMIQFAKDGERLFTGAAAPSNEQLTKSAGTFFAGVAPEKVAAVKDGEGAAGLFA
jgi:hypothetical protein